MMSRKHYEAFAAAFKAQLDSTAEIAPNPYWQQHAIVRTIMAAAIW